MADSQRQPGTRRSLFPARVRGLGYHSGNRRLIDGIDLELEPDGITVILGPNGAGKSLLLRLLHGLIVPSRGEILWGGQRMGKELRRRQAMVFQRPVLLRRSVAANVDFVLAIRNNADPRRRDELLRHVGLGDRAQQSARRLSGGEQQRLALARALALNPEVLLMDEPSASLDPASTERIEQIAREAQSQGTKILFVTHDLGQARRLAADVVFLHHGRVLEHTEARRFFEHPLSSEAADFLAGRLVL